MNDDFRPRCPSCDILIDPAINPSQLPFCSDRCRLIDLGRWLNEEHAIPWTPDDEEAQAQTGTPAPGAPQLPPGWHDP